MCPQKGLQNFSETIPKKGVLEKEQAWPQQLSLASSIKKYFLVWKHTLAIAIHLMWLNTAKMALTRAEQHYNLRPLKLWAKSS